MNGEVKQAPLPADLPASSFWTAYRRPFLLVSLVISLILFLIWLPDWAVTALVTGLIAQRVLVGLFFFFTLIVMSMLWSVGESVDNKVFLFFNLWSYHPPWLDRLMWLLTQLGNVVTAILLAGYFYLQSDRRMAAEIILGTITLWLVVETIKALSNRGRPFLTLKGTRLIGWQERGRSFPSGHTSQSFFLVTFLIYQLQPDPVGTIALYTAAALVGFTRIYVGVHYPRDVVAGAILGSMWGILAMLLDPFWVWLNF